MFLFRAIQSSKVTAESNCMKRSFLRLAAILVVLTGAASAQSSDTHFGAVETYVKGEMDRQHIPGLALLVAREGKIVRAQGFGFANLEHRVVVKPETVFQSGSLGKQFTATAVMMLVEDGDIGLDDSITKYLSDAPASWKPVTVRHLLSNTAGFTDYPKGFDFRREYTEDQLLKIVAGIPLAFPPGTKYRYSNLGYVTLGILIHRVTGKFYGDVLEERIFGPLGMQTARIMSETDIVPNRAAGYHWVKGQLQNQEWVSETANTTADGSLLFSILDLAKWDAALYTEKLLKHPSLELMWTPVKLNDGKPNSGNYGFGWRITDSHGHRLIAHEGAWQGFEGYISRYVDDKLTVVVLTNLGEAYPGRIADAVAQIYLAPKTKSKAK
jgi:CubicO group peptidase (beta-lactamase class C family)